MDIQTATTTIVTIQLSAEEANSALLDPSSLQAALARALSPDLSIPPLDYLRQRGSVGGNPLQGGNGHAKTQKPRGKAGPKAKATKYRKVAPPRECPFCHAMKAPQGYNRHVAACEARHLSSDAATVDA